MPRHLVFCIVWLACGGCANVSVAPPQSLYQRLGGMQAITALVDDGVRNIAADTRINRRFRDAAPSRLTKNLIDLVCLRTGGPCTYRGLDMATAHDGMNIRDDEFDALVDDLAKSLDRFGVGPRERRELLGIVGQMRSAVVGH
jgi:hemoglobin